MSNEKGKNDLRDNLATFRGGGRAGGVAKNGFSKSQKDKKVLEQKAKDIIREFTRFGGQSQVLAPMSREQRKVLHEMAQRLGITTKSHGKEPNRFVVISVREQQLNRAKPMTEAIEPAGRLLDKVGGFLAQHPISQKDVEHCLDEQATRLYQQKGAVVKSRVAVPPKSECPVYLKKDKDKLPASKYREQTLGAIAKCSVVIISGGTGCGKTTQVPQFILENAHHKQQKVRILVTQPRRIAAISIAERVAKERGEQIGDTVGYQVRLESKKSERTLLTYCTTGVLLRMLTSDPKATGITHIIMDEIHEREINTDYLLIALRECLQKRKDLKIILMSATIEGSMALFCTYFEKYSMKTIKIESQLRHVEIFHLDQILAMSGYEPPKDRSFFAPFHFEADQWQEEIAEIRKEEEQKKRYYEQEPPPAPPPQLDTEFDFNYDSVGNSNGEWVSGACTTMNGQIIDGTTMEQFMVAVGGPPVRPMLLQMRPSSPKSLYLEGVRYQVDETQPAETLAGHTLRRASMPVVELNLDAVAAPMSPAVPTPSSTKSGLGRFTSDGFGFGEKHAYAELIEKKFREEMKSVLPNRPVYYHTTVDKQVAATDFKKLRFADKYAMFYGADYVTSINHHLVDTVVKYLADSPIFGSILVFLPGYDDIQEMLHRVSQWQDSLTNVKKVLVIPLHSQMHSVDHSDIFKPVPSDTRKIILSTNIAEASITIPDVVFVVDTGRAKEKTYNHETKLSALTVSPISKSNARQRSGRAGRVADGYCFRLYSEKEYATMADNQLAEMKRAAIYDVTLHAKIFAPKNMKIAEFLALAPEPPSSEAIVQAMQFLEQIGALYSRKKYTEHQASSDEDPEITDLGRLMARLPLDPNLSRMLLFGLALKCLTPIVNLVAMLANRDPFILTTDKAREDQNRMKCKFAQNDFSDHLMLIRICSEFCAKPHGEQFKFCRDNFLNMSTMRMVSGTRRQLLQELCRAKLIWIRPERDLMTVLNDRVHNKHAESWPMVQAAIAAGSYPAVGVCPADSKLKKIQTYNSCPSGIHPSSIVKKQIRPSKATSEPRLEYVAFQELCQTPDSGSLLMKMVTAFPSLTALLFTGPLRMSQQIVDEHNIVNDDGEPTDTTEEIESSGPRFDEDVFELDSWYTVTANKKTLCFLLRLRHKFMHFFLKSIGEPTRFGVDTHHGEHQMLTLIRELLESEHNRYNFTRVDMPKMYLKSYEQKQSSRASPRVEDAPRADELNRSLPNGVQNQCVNNHRKPVVQNNHHHHNHQVHQNHHNHSLPHYNPQRAWQTYPLRMYTPPNYPPPVYFNSHFPPQAPPLSVYNVAQPPPSAPGWSSMASSPVNYPLPSRPTAGCSLRGGGAPRAHYRNTGDRGHHHSYGAHH